jgi:amino acid permease
MEPSVEVFLVIAFVVIFHFLIFYLLTRKKKNIEGKQKNTFRWFQVSQFSFLSQENMSSSLEDRQESVFGSLSMLHDSVLT